MRPPLLGLQPNANLGPPCDAAQAELPLVEALEGAAHAVRAPFFFPGHKMGQAAPAPLRRMLGMNALRHDLPELPELDNLFAPEGAILHAQELAAQAFSAERTYFLCNGSTAGILAAVTACVQQWHQSGGGRRRGTRPVLLVPRNAHKSVYSAMVVAGAEPCWITPEYDVTSGLCLGVAAASVAAGLARVGPTRVAGVLLVSPTYEGVLSDVRAASALCRASGVPLIVDEAHGAHLTFLTSPTTSVSPADGRGESVAAGGDGSDLVPRGALLDGADLVVQSTHKTLGALTQSAMLHTSPTALAAFPSLAIGLGQAVELYQSSSPNYLLLASLDAARWQMAAPRARGRARLMRAADHAAWLRQDVERMPAGGPRVASFTRGPGVHAVDPLRVTLLPPLVVDGPAAQDDMKAEAETEAEAEEEEGDGWGFEFDELLISEGVYAELPQAHALTFALSAGTTRRHVRRLSRALRRSPPKNHQQIETGPPADRSDGTAKPPADGTARGSLTPADGTARGSLTPADGTARGSLTPALREAARSASSLAPTTVPPRPTVPRLSPRSAYMHPRVVLPADDAVGRPSAELVCPYPPGIPTLLPGELITHEALAQLRRLRAAGCTISGCADPSLQTLAVLDAMDDQRVGATEERQLAEELKVAAYDDDYEEILEAGLAP